MSNIFISYRRVDSDVVAHRIYDVLCEKFCQHCVFLDVDKIPFVDFREHLLEKVWNAEVMLVLIGEGWLSSIQKRGNDANDFVRMEGELALKSGITII